MIVNKRIAKYSKIIKILYVVSVVVSVLTIISQSIDRGLNGEWYIWKDILDAGYDMKSVLLVSMYILGMFSLSYIGATFTSGIALTIDCAKIFECVNIKSKADISNAKIKILNSTDKLKICAPIIGDICFSLLSSICCSSFFTNGYFLIIFARYWGSFVGAHLCSYITIIFYALCCKEKKKELSKDLPSYLADKKKELHEKWRKEKFANDKKITQQLLEKCGMKFFLKYYKLLIRLPIRDIEVDENYAAEEKSERITAAKSILEQDFSQYAAQHILDNYSDLLTDDEKATASEIISTK